MSHLYEGITVVDNVIYMPDEELEPDPRGIGPFYFDCMSKHRNLIAQIDGPTGTKDTFGDLLRRCIQSAVAMQKLGIEYGDVVSLCTYNHLNSCVPHISSMFIGAKVAALDPSLSLEAASHLLRQVMPKIMFVQEESLELVENALRDVGCETNIVVFGATDNHVSFDEFAKPIDGDMKFKPVAARNMHDVALILFSSGTSGFPKGICHTHYSILYSSLRNFPNHESFLIFASDSPYWNVFMLMLNYSVRKGLTRLVYPSYDLKEPWRIFDYKITHAFFNTTELVTLTNTEKPPEVDTSKLFVIMTGGSIMYDYQICKARSLFPRSCVVTVYGQSEVFPTVLSFYLRDPRHIALVRQKPGSCGTPIVGLSYKVVDPDTDEVVGPNQQGELRLKTKMQLSGYYNVDSSEVWDSDGWLKTGDYGYYDEDYYFYIVGRVKEAFKYRYWHILPAVVEKKILQHPKVSKAVVIGIPHETDNNHAMAVVVLKRTGVDVTEDALRKDLDDLVEDREKLRGGVRIVDSFPMTPSGKVNRFKLKQLVLANQI